jgi:ring-1,2-phenylacetyl-CoA epoxidase subunit PaaC
MRDSLLEYVFRLGDDALILGQRLSTWCGHAPNHEVDLGLSSLALDLVGQATDFLDLAAAIEGKGQDADTLAFRRDPPDYHNCLLVEQPNGDFAQTLARQFLFSNWQAVYLDALSGSANTDIARIASKSLRDVQSHVEFCRDWMIRMGDGDCVNNKRLIISLDAMARYVDELFVMDDVDNKLLAQGIAVDKPALRTEFDAKVNTTLRQAGLAHPRPAEPIIGGRRGHHSEHLGHMLAEMTLPMRNAGARW